MCSCCNIESTEQLNLALAKNWSQQASNNNTATTTSFYHYHQRNNTVKTPLNFIKSHVSIYQHNYYCMLNLIKLPFISKFTIFSLNNGTVNQNLEFEYDQYEYVQDIHLKRFWL